MSRKERRTHPHPVDDDMGRSNPAYFSTETTQAKDPISMEISEFQKRGLFFANVNYLSQNDAQGAPRPGNNFRRPNFSQSEV